MDSLKIGLALGCGGARGWAHIGVIEALTEGGIPIHLVAGCSVGSFVGAIFASGGLEKLKKYVIEMDGESMFSFSDISLLKPGLLDGDRKLKELFSIHSDKETFEETNIPLKVVAADMFSGDPVVFDSGDLMKALRASMSYPGLFAPVYHNGRWLIDGGVVDPVPVGVTRAMGAQIVIAVNLESSLISNKHHQKAKKSEEEKPRQFKNEFLNSISTRYEAAEKLIRERLIQQTEKKLDTPNTKESVNAAIQIMRERIMRVNFAVNQPDILITPRLGDLKMLDYDQVEHAIEEGYIAAKDKINDIKRLMDPQAN